MSSFTAFVSWPTAPFTESLVKNALLSSVPSPVLVSSLPANHVSRLLQWSTYDDIEHELTNSKHDSVLSSSYTFRKCLIRKHFLSRCIFSYLTKHPNSILKHAWPRTFEIEISFADELDEMFTDELWELGEELRNSHKWWILKPGMADRGNGIRMFNDRASLEQIFIEFEEGSDNESEEDDNPTSVVTSQLRHFVIQEYILNPLLLDPREVLIGGSDKPERLLGHKFHIRAYCVASGALTLYLYDRILALFSAVPYNVPEGQADALDLSPHLTNTSLQTHRGEEGVRLLEELVGCRVLSKSDADDDLVLTAEDVSNIKRQMVEALAGIFKAALENPVNFQALPNAFELFGVDFLVAHDSSGYQVKVLELNAEPAIELTGPRLAWILEDLFIAMRKVCVEPFFSDTPLKKEWGIGEVDEHLMKCLEVEVRGS